MEAHPDGLVMQDRASRRKEKAPLQARLDAAYRAIDQHVYEPYAPPDEEMAMVAEPTA